MEDCTCAEEAGAELALKVESGQDIIYRKSGLGNATSALVDKDFASIISNKTRHYKMAARAVHSKNHMTQETEKTLEGLYRYYSYVQLNL